VPGRPVGPVLFRGGRVTLGVALGLKTVEPQFLRGPLRLGVQPAPELFRARGGFGSGAGGYLAGVLRNPALASSATGAACESARAGSQGVKVEGAKDKEGELSITAFHASKYKAMICQ